MGFKLDWNAKLFIVLLVIGLLVRLAVFNVPFFVTESWRDYLISEHIVSGERILVGPSTSSGLMNSPLYNYLLAGFLLVHDSYIFLGIVNIVFQIIAVIAVYLLGRGLFGPGVALLGAVLFSFSAPVLSQSEHIWQPHLMLPFATLSFLFLFLAASKKRFGFLVLSTVLFVVAGALHLSVFFLTPLFLFLAFLIVRKHFALRDYAKVLGVFVAAFIVFFLSVFVYYYQTASFSLDLIFDWPNEKYGERFITHLIANASLLVGDSEPNLLFGAVVLVVIFAAFGVYYATQKDKERRFYGLCLFGGCALVAVVLSLFRVSLLTAGHHNYYFTAVFGLAALLFAELTTFFSNRSVYPKAVAFVVAVVLIAFSGLDYFSRLFERTAAPILRGEPIPTMGGEFQFYERFAANLSESIKGLQEENGFAGPHFFRLAFVDDYSQTGINIDAPLWVLLEKNFNTRFVETNERVHWFGYQPTTSDNYLFLLCERLNRPVSTSGDEFCLERFFANYGSYDLVERLYFYPDKFSVYLMKKRTLLP